MAPKRIDNDDTKGIARPFVVLAHVRAGGTFMCHCLSNHPQVHCDRGEVMHHNSIWRQAFHVKPAVLMSALHDQTGYHASGFRLIYRQAFHKRVWPYLTAKLPHIIWLQRGNVVAQALSYQYHQLVRGRALPYHAVHSFEEKAPDPVVFPVEHAVYAVKKVHRENKAGRDRMSGYRGKVLQVLYEDATGNVQGSAPGVAPDAAERICAFLGVRNEPLTCDLKRDFPRPWRELLSNWQEIAHALRQAGFGTQVQALDAGS